VLIADLLSHDDLDRYVTAIRVRLPQVEIEAAASGSDVLARAPRCSILVIGDPAIDQSFIDCMPQLEWIHALTSGTNRTTALRFAGKRPLITSSRGMHGPQMSELTLLHMLSAARQFPRMLDNARAHRWQRWPQVILAGRTVLLLGVGSIAEALAPRCKSFEMRVVGMSGSRREVAGFDRIVLRTEVDAELVNADFVVVLLPHNAENHMFVNADFLQRMKAGAILISVSRGSIVDETALLQALGSGHIRHAGLDVFATEPLPPDSPLWESPRVTLTPHVGGMSDRYAEQALPILLKNLAAFLAGRVSDMVNIVP
jgi:phosphoglycerate dehydrogenase-like enzyme